MTNQELPKNTNKDYLHASIKGGLSEIPFIGGIISEFFGLAVVSPVQKRHEIWLKSLYEEIDILKEHKEEYTIESLQKNENFISIVTQASSHAIKNHQVEKLEYLKNATLNSITSTIDFEDQVVFLDYIESFTLLHIKILNCLEKRGINGIDSKSDQLSDINIYEINSNAPGWKRKHVLQDLDNKGLIEKNYHLQFNSKNMLLKISISEFGKEFLKYIRK
jgi:hypothetical protein